MSGLSVSLSFMSLHLSKMSFKLRIRLVCSHSDKYLEVELFKLLSKCKYVNFKIIP